MICSAYSYTGQTIRHSQVNKRLSERSIDLSHSCFHPCVIAKNSNLVMVFGEENKVMPRICLFCFLDSEITSIKYLRVRVGRKQYKLTHVGTKTLYVVLMLKSTFRVLPVTFLGWPWMDETYKPDKCIRLF